MYVDMSFLNRTEKYFTDSVSHILRDFWRSFAKMPVGILNSILYTPKNTMHYVLLFF